MRIDDLKGRAVVTLSDANKIGAIDDCYFDPVYRQVLGFRVKSHAFGPVEALPRASVAAIGANAVTVATPDVLVLEERFRASQPVALAHDLNGSRVVTEGGELLGAVHDLELDDEALNVTALVLDAPLLDHWRHRVPLITTDRIQRIGQDGIIVVRGLEIPAQTAYDGEDPRPNPPPNA